MLTLVTLLLMSFAFSAAIIWLSRPFFVWKSANQRPAGRPRTIKAKPAPVAKMRTVSSGDKVPWGW